MNIKENINYFKKTDTPKYVGLGLMIVGFAMLWLGWSYISYILMSIFIPAGIVLFLVGSSGRAGDSDIEAAIKKATEGVEVDLTEDKNYNKRILKHLSPETVEGYEYREGLLLTRAKSGSLRSSEYTKAVIYMLSDALYIPARTISLVSDNVNNRYVEIPYDMIDKVEITHEEANLTYGKKTFRAKIVRLSIEYGDGLVFTTPIHDDITSDALVENIKKMISTARKENA